MKVKEHGKQKAEMKIGERLKEKEVARNITAFPIKPNIGNRQKKRK